MKRLVTALLTAVLVVSALPAAAVPVAVQPLPPVNPLPVVPPPSLSADAWILYDATHDLVLSSHQPDIPRPMASTTKIMTALVAIEAGESERLVTVTQEADDVGEAEIGLVRGEQIPLGELIRVLLVRSANDAAIAVAEAVAGSEEAFVELMNQRAEALGLTGTRFANPHGLDAPDHHSTPRDLLTLTLAAMQHPEFAEAVSTTRFRFADAPDGSQRIAESTNRLLADYPGAIGIKTGFTSRAGLVLVAAAEQHDRRLFAVVMGSDPPGGHFTDAERLLDHGYEHFDVVALVRGGTRIVEVDPELASLAAAEALIHLAALSSRQPAITAVERTDRLPDPETDTDPLPGVSDAFAWVDRYLDWMVGDG